MPNEIEAGRAAMPPEQISQEAARAMLAALRTTVAMLSNLGGMLPGTRECVLLVVDEARDAIALTERGA